MLTPLLLSLVLASAPDAGPAAAPAPDAGVGPRAGYRVHDLTPTFWAYWDGVKDAPQDVQVRRFVEEVVARHPEVYSSGVLGFPEDVPVADGLARRWPRFLGFVGPHLPLARELSQTVGRDLPGYDARFRQAFPDFAYDGDVYFLVSMGAFDGGTRSVQGRTALLFGVDVMAAVYGRDADPASFFHHELFHLYQEPLEAPGFGDTLGGALWREGLAVYVAEQLNPGTSEAVLFGLPRDMPERARARLPALARTLRAKLDSREREDYARFFTGQHDSAEVPARVGYYLGYRVVKEVAGKRTLRELARLTGPALRKELDRALARLGRKGAR